MFRDSLIVEPLRQPRCEQPEQTPLCKQTALSLNSAELCDISNRGESSAQLLYPICILDRINGVVEYLQMSRMGIGLRIPESILVSILTIGVNLRIAGRFYSFGGSFCVPKDRDIPSRTREELRVFLTREQEGVFHLLLSALALRSHETVFIHALASRMSQKLAPRSFRLCLVPRVSAVELSDNAFSASGAIGADTRPEPFDSSQSAVRFCRVFPKSTKKNPEHLSATPGKSSGKGLFGTGRTCDQTANNSRANISGKSPTLFL